MRFQAKYDNALRATLFAADATSAKTMFAEILASMMFDPSKDPLTTDVRDRDGVHIKVRIARSDISADQHWSSLADMQQLLLPANLCLDVTVDADSVAAAQEKLVAAIKAIPQAIVETGTVCFFKDGRGEILLCIPKSEIDHVGNWTD